MPAKSKSQANLFKIVYGFKTGAIKSKDMPDSLRDKVKNIAKGISKKDAKDLMRQEDMLLKQKDRGVVEPEDDKEDRMVLMDKALRELKLEIRMLYENNMEAQKFFKQTQINKAFTKLKRIWQNGGESNENILYNEIKDNASVFTELFLDLLDSKSFRDFMNRNDYDINPRFMRSINMYFNGVARIADEDNNVEERELSEEELEDIYNSLNKFTLYVFVEAIIDYRKRAFKDPVINS